MTKQSRAHASTAKSVLKWLRAVIQLANTGQIDARSTSLIRARNGEPIVRVDTQAFNSAPTGRAIAAHEARRLLAAAVEHPTCIDDLVNDNGVTVSVLSDITDHRRVRVIFGGIGAAQSILAILLTARITRFPTWRGHLGDGILDRLSRCAHCGQFFLRATSKPARFCSALCRYRNRSASKDRSPEADVRRHTSPA